MQFVVTLPEWAIRAQHELPTHLLAAEDQMREVVRFAQLNIDNRSGGPFAAGIFERDTGKRIVIGVNRVIPSNVSSAHAEIVALSVAQQLLNRWDLGSSTMPALQLVVNWRPCAMCYGAIIWSGIRSLVIAGSDDACEQITGFDEGPIHPDWRNELAKRGIALQDGVLYDQAVAVFRNFRDSCDVVYNARRS